MVWADSSPEELSREPEEWELSGLRSKELARAAELGSMSRLLPQTAVIMDSFKEAIIQQLDSSGVLDPIRVQLRALVYSAVEAKARPKVDRSDACKATDSEEGQLAAYLFKDFLETFKASYTLNVFLPECKVTDAEPELLKKLEIAREPGLPLIFSLFKHLLPAGHASKHAPMPFRGEPVVMERPTAAEQVPVFNSKPVTQVSTGSYAALDLAEPKGNLAAALDLAVPARNPEDPNVERKRLTEIEVTNTQKRIAQFEQSDKKGKLMEIRADLEGSDEKYEEDFEE